MKKSEIFRTQHIKLEIRNSLQGRVDIIDKYDEESALIQLISEWRMIQEQVNMKLGILNIDGKIKDEDGSYWQNMKLPFKLP